jgi:hypothetical protein
VERAEILAKRKFKASIKGFKEGSREYLAAEKLFNDEVRIAQEKAAAEEKSRKEELAAFYKQAAADQQALINKEFADTLKSTDEFFKSEQLKYIDNNEALAQLEVQRLETQLQNAKDYGQFTIDLELEIAKKKKEIKEKEVEEQKNAGEFIRKRNDFILSSTRDTLGALSSLVTEFGKKGNEQSKKSFELSKKIQIAEALVSTFTAAQGAYRSQMTATPDSPIRGAIAATIATLAGLARVKAISNTQIGGSPSQPSEPSTNIPEAPNAEPSSAIIRTATGAGASGDVEPIKVYVTEGDITKSQRMVRSADLKAEVL